MHKRSIAVENIVRKGEIACDKQFLLFSQCFLCYMVLIFHFKCTLKCRLQFVSIWTSLKILLSGNGLRRNRLRQTNGGMDKQMNGQTDNTKILSFHLWQWIITKWSCTFTWYIMLNQLYSDFYFLQEEIKNLDIWRD